ncbi:MAG: NPCBM/NEW2 domain-containing protein [bacterium]
MKKIIIVLISCFSFFVCFLNQYDTKELIEVVEVNTLNSNNKKMEDYYYDGEEYVTYLTDSYSKLVYSSAGTIDMEYDHQGDKISLYGNDKENQYEKGIASSNSNTGFTFTSVQEYGYEYFETYVGVHVIARDAGRTPSFKFEILTDGEIAYTKTYSNAYAEQEFVSIPLEGVEVLQIFVKIINSSGSGNYAGYGDPLFRKAAPTPYLDVFDMEFSNPDQVTSLNLLEYAKAYDMAGNDISSSVQYETDFTEGKTGVFSLTYYVFDSNEVMRKREVSLLVLDIDYTQTWTLEDFKTPYVNYLYHARSSYSNQMKKLFDLIVDAGLNFDDTQWTKRYRSNIYTSQNFKSFNLYNEGIYLKYSDVNSVLDGIWDCEPRIFMILELDLMASYYCSTDSSTNLTNSAGFWAQNLTTDQYNSRIQQILGNSETFLSYAKDDMTYAQKWKYVTDAYNKKVHYNDGANLYNSMGLLVAKCNGNSQGLVYLAQRLGIKSIYAEGWSDEGLHAWTYQKLPDEEEWYLTDKLWYTTLGTVEGYTSNHAVYSNRTYTFPKTSNVAYNSYNYTYPSVWATFVSETINCVVGENVDLYDNIKTISSIFSTVPTIDDISIKIVFGNKEYSIDQIPSLSNGLYTAIYSIEYHHGSTVILRDYEIDLVIFEPEIDYESINSNLVTTTVYGGGAQNENMDYDQSNEIEGLGYNLTDGQSISIDVSEINSNALTLKYSTRITARTNSWTMDNCHISLTIKMDGVSVVTTASLKAWSTYIDVFVSIPDGTQTITFTNNKLSSGGCHGAIIDIQFGTVSIATQYSTGNGGTTALFVATSIGGSTLLFGVGGFFLLSKSKSYNNEIKDTKDNNSKTSTKVETKSATKKASTKTEVKPSSKVEPKTTTKKTTPKAETKNTSKKPATKVETKSTTKKATPKAEAKPTSKKATPKVETKTAAKKTTKKTDENK